MKKAMVSLIIILLTLIVVFSTGLKITGSRTFQFFGGITDRIDTHEKVVALTFDDGPTEKTGEILDLLEDLDVRVTFFITGEELEQNKEEGKKIISAGHELGNHSYSHTRMVFKSPSFIREEIDVTNQLIRETGYQGDIHFRPPFGKKMFILPHILNQNGQKTIMWDVEPDSFPEIASSSEKIVDHVIENVEPGSIVLMHIMYESRAESLNAIEGIVKSLRAEGYSFKTVSELLEYNKSI